MNVNLTQGSLSQECASQCVYRRRLGYLQRHPPATPLPCVLADVIREAPRLLEFLPSDAWSALSTSSRLLRHLIHSHTKTAFVDSPDDVKLLFQGTWPQLSTVIVREAQAASEVEHQPVGKMQLLAACQLGDMAVGYAATVVLLVRPKARQQQFWPARHRRMSISSLSFLQQPKWHQLQHLALDHINLSPQGLAQLVSVSWPEMRRLYLRRSKLGSAGMAQLAQGRWPQLQTLAIAHTGLDAAAVAHLMTGSWPLLKHLWLGQNADLDEKACGLLATAHWPNLRVLDLTGVKLNAACVHNLVQAHWPQLDMLMLEHTGVDADAIAELANAKWPLLTSLFLQDNAMGAQAMAQLVLAPFPRLASLTLCKNKLNAAAAKHLASSNWPLLSILALYDNYLDDAAMFHLAQANWPLLEWLHLEQNKISAIGIEFLTHSNWMNFCELGLDRRSVSEQTYTLLQLDPTTLPGDAHCTHYEAITAQRQTHSALSDQAMLWPHMHSVRFAARHNASKMSSKLMAVSLRFSD